jgi:hypothetical protein
MEHKTKPSLVEPGVRYFINATLKKCSDTKNAYHNHIFNISCLVGFLIVLGIFLLIRYKGRLSPIEKEKKMHEQRHYILSKIKQFQNIKQQKRQELITNLPKWESDFKIMNEKFYK